MASILTDDTSDTGTPSAQERAARLRDFLHDCVASDAWEEADRVREALVLLHGPGAGIGTSMGMGMGMGPRPDAIGIAAMLDCGAAESAVIALLGPAATFMVSRGEGQACLATVISAPGEEEIIAEGASVALALLGAYASSVLAILVRGDNPSGRGAPPASARLH